MLRFDAGLRQGAFTLQTAFEAGQGTTVLYGRSGSGKTTIADMIAGLRRPQRGRIELGGRVLFDAATGINLPVHQRRIGYVFQEARLFPHLSVEGNLDFGARYAGAPLAGRPRDDLIDLLGLGALLERWPARLSGGEKQRVALARALITAPDLLLLDEPLAGLDTERKADILPYLERLRDAGGPPMIYVSHDMDEITRLADRLVILRDGRCVAQGAAEAVLSDPAHVPFVGVQQAGALVRGVVAPSDDASVSLVRLSACDLVVPRLAMPEGAQLRLRIRAQDVIIARQKPQQMSSQNILKVRIGAIHRGAGNGVALGLESGADRLLARITARAMARLDLQEGQEVWAIVKASSVAPGAISMQRA